MRTFLFVLALLALAWVLTRPEAAPDRLTGHARVIDGDTFDLGSRRIRVFGIDAPESATPAGPAATEWLRQRIAGRSVSCLEKDTDRYGRTVATCYVGGEDIAAAMVREGWAEAFRHYSTDYVDEEETARAAHLGIWSAPLIEASAPRACPIKGNISSKGKRIYHVPGNRDYDLTKIDEAKGERWFCTESEARAAGWMPVGG